MASPSGAVPLSAYDASLQSYLSGMALDFQSVAGRIIAERLPAGFARDPLRPRLLLWAAAANGCDLADALPVAAAFDLFDRFMLLHDELATDGAKTADRWGLGQSLNAGDALYALAFRCLASDVHHPSRRLLAARIAAEAVLEAIEGRDGTTGGRCALTGGALQAGAAIAGAPGDVAAAFAAAGRALGMAADARDAATAQEFTRHAVALLQPHAGREDLDAFSEAARCVARQAA